MNARLIFNFIAFQIGWLACVLGGAQQQPWLGTALTLVLVAVHLSLAPRPRSELFVILAVGLIGALWDSLLVALGWLVFPSGTLLPGTAPHWIVAMWMLFATTLNVSMRWLRRRWLLAALLGAVGGPLAYFAGARLGGVTFPDMQSALWVLAAGWAVLMPVLMVLAERFDATRPVLRQPVYA